MVNGSELIIGESSSIFIRFMCKYAWKRPESIYFRLVNICFSMQEKVNIK